MIIDEERIEKFNQKYRDEHQASTERLISSIPGHVNFDWVVKKVGQFQIAIPSWALGAGGTRFGRFGIGGEPCDLSQKIEDIALLHQLTRRTDAVSLHIPWDIPEDADHIRQLADSLGIGFDAMNSNTFQDYGQPLSYKLGSLGHSENEVREQAVKHNQEVIEVGKKLGSKGLTVWLADGSNFPGQHSLRDAFSRTKQSLEKIYASLPADWKLLLEYKPFEPNFYSTNIPDWGTAYVLSKSLGEQAKVLVDLGHHLPNTNIEQIVSTLLYEKMLAGFHFNDSKYGDDDLTTGSIKPFQLFLIFCELISGTGKEKQSWESISWMIDASHNVKDPLEDLMQALEAISIAYAKALIVDREALASYRHAGDVTMAEATLQEAYQTDIRPLIREARLLSGGICDPIKFYREFEYRKMLIQKRGYGKSTGL